MKCHDIKKWIGEYIDGELVGAVQEQVSAHLDQCVHCRKEYETMAKVWGALAELPDQKPSAAYISRFWTKVAVQGSACDSWASIKNILKNRKLVPVVTALSVMFIVGSVNFLQVRPVNQDLNQLAGEDVELIQNMDVAEHFDIVKDIEILEDMDVIQSLDHMQS